VWLWCVGGLDYERGRVLACSTFQLFIVEEVVQWQWPMWQ